MFRWLHDITSTRDLALIPKTPSELVVEGRMPSDHSKTNSPIHLTVAGNHKAGFDDVLYVMKRIKKSDPLFLLINTLPVTEQDNLIPHTLSYQLEEGFINEIIADYKRDPAHYTVIVYGKHGADDSVDKKYKQLVGLGFSHTFIYYGGMFEWMLLQDVYGADHFPTTNMGFKDPLKYAPRCKFS